MVRAAFGLATALALSVTTVQVQAHPPVQSLLQGTDPLRVKVRGGFSLLDLKRYADAHGLEGVGYMNLPLDDLIDLAPAIVPVEVRGYPHFVVVRGRTGGEGSDRRSGLRQPEHGGAGFHACLEGEHRPGR
jgi:predicted double-glycine peptidase